jgi:hypothetical protein
MKKYRLKSELVKYFHIPKVSDLEPTVLDNWQRLNISIEALEEVPQRVELIHYNLNPNKLGDLYFLNKIDNKKFTDQELDLCEKALNGELLDFDTFDSDDYSKWYMGEDGSLDYLKREGLTLGELLKAYLKSKPIV